MRGKSMEDEYAVTPKNVLRALIKLRIENHQDIDVIINQFKKAYQSESDERTAFLGLTIEETAVQAVKDFTKKRAE